MNVQHQQTKYSLHVITVTLYSGASASAMHTPRWRSLNAKVESDTCTLINRVFPTSLAQSPHVPYHACIVVQGPTLSRQHRRPRPNPRLKETNLMRSLCQHPKLKVLGSGRCWYMSEVKFWMFMPSGNSSGSVSLVDPWLRKNMLLTSLWLTYSPTCNFYSMVPADWALGGSDWLHVGFHACTKNFMCALAKKKKTWVKA